MGVIGGFILGLVALFIPPLPVLVRTGCGLDLVINILLTILGWFPGVLHAWYIIIRFPSSRGARRQRVYSTGSGHAGDHSHYAHGGHAGVAHYGVPSVRKGGYYTQPAPPRSGYRARY